MSCAPKMMVTVNVWPQIHFVFYEQTTTQRPHAFRTNENFFSLRNTYNTRVNGMKKIQFTMEKVYF